MLISLICMCSMNACSPNPHCAAEAQITDIQLFRLVPRTAVVREALQLHQCDHNLDGIAVSAPAQEFSTSRTYLNVSNRHYLFLGDASTQCCSAELPWLDPTEDVHMIVNASSCALYLAFIVHKMDYKIHDTVRRRTTICVTLLSMLESTTSKAQTSVPSNSGMCYNAVHAERPRSAADTDSFEAALNLVQKAFIVHSTHFLSE